MGYLDKFGFDEIYFDELLQQTLREDDNLKQFPTMLDDLLSLCLDKGKRIRPLFLLLSASLGDCNKKDMYQAAVAIELLHLSSLIHDDIIDGASTRRGVVTLHTTYDAYIAMRLGNFLLNKSMSLFSVTLSKEGHLTLARTMSCLCLGEFKQAHDQFNFELSEVDYFEKSFKKTGILLSTSLVLGGLISELPLETIELLDELGRDIGIAYQLLDDISDFTATKDEALKPTQTDLKNGVITLPTIYALSDDLLKDDILSLNSDVDDSQISSVYDKIKASDYIQKSQQTCDTYINQAYEKVSKLPKHQSLFSNLIGALVRRH